MVVHGWFTVVHLSQIPPPCSLLGPAKFTLPTARPFSRSVFPTGKIYLASDPDTSLFLPPTC